MAKIASLDKSDIEHLGPKKNQGINVSIIMDQARKAGLNTNSDINKASIGVSDHSYNSSKQYLKSLKNMEKLTGTSNLNKSLGNNTGSSSKMHTVANIMAPSNGVKSSLA